MNKIVTYSFVEALYVIYVLNYLKTRYSLAHPLSNFNSSYWVHPIGISQEPVSNICEFGHNASWFLAAFILLRICFIKSKYNRYLSMFVLVIVASLSMLNFNAVAYLVPYFIFEIYLLKNNFRL
jgi:hypothetical protein